MFYISLTGWIILIVALSIVGVWLLALIVNLIFVASFSSIFKKHKEAIPVIVYTKYDNLKTIVSILKQSGVAVDNRCIALLNDLSNADFVEPGSNQFVRAKNTLSYLAEELFNAASQHPELEGDAEYMLAKRNILECDTQYRNTVMMYNADVLGYNYWVRFLPCRFVFLMFKVKLKETIS